MSKIVHGAGGERLEADPLQHLGINGKEKAEVGDISPFLAASAHPALLPLQRHPPQEFDPTDKACGSAGCAQVRMPLSPVFNKCHDQEKHNTTHMLTISSSFYTWQEVLLPCTQTRLRAQEQ